MAVAETASCSGGRDGDAGAAAHDDGSANATELRAQRLLLLCAALGAAAKALLHVGLRASGRAGRNRGRGDIRNTSAVDVGRRRRDGVSDGLDHVRDGGQAAQVLRFRVRVVVDTRVLGGGVLILDVVLIRGSIVLSSGSIGINRAFLVVHIVVVAVAAEDGAGGDVVVERKADSAVAELLIIAQRDCPMKVRKLRAIEDAANGTRRDRVSAAQALTRHCAVVRRLIQLHGSDGSLGWGRRSRGLRRSLGLRFDFGLARWALSGVVDGGDLLRVREHGSQDRTHVYKNKCYVSELALSSNMTDITTTRGAT